MLDPFEGKDILIVTTKDDHTTAVLLERSPLPNDDKTWKVSSWDSLVRLRKKYWDNELKDGMTLLLEKTGLKREKSNFLYNPEERSFRQCGNTCGFMAFMNTVQKLTGESLDEAHWPKCVAVIRVFFGLWQIKIEESTKFRREGYLANQLEKAVNDVQLIGVLSAVSPAPSGVDPARRRAAAQPLPGPATPPPPPRPAALAGAAPGRAGRRWESGGGAWPGGGGAAARPESAPPCRSAAAARTGHPAAPAAPRRAGSGGQDVRL
jgi:hypothetical protein